MNVLLVRGCMYVVCRSFKTLKDLFVYPLPSSSIGIYQVSGLSKGHFVAPISDIVSKCVCLKYETANNSTECHSHDYAVFPIVHTISQ